MDANAPTIITPSAGKTTLLPASKFLEVAGKFNFTILEQAGFWKVSGPKGHNIYVAKNAKGVRRVDISGWKLDATLLDNTVGPFGNVTGQLSLKGDEAEQLARFELACADMQSQPEKVPAPKATPPRAPVTPAAEHETKTTIVQHGDTIATVTVSTS